MVLHPDSRAGCTKFFLQHTLVNLCSGSLRKEHLWLPHGTVALRDKSKAGR